MNVYQVSIHDMKDDIVTVITAAKNRREAIVKVLEANPDLTDLGSIYAIIIADAVIL